ncbi:hypothetical protein [Flavisolibacter tropicus]|uniref:hypothetical protein n=1 Tax=Flavisolibacter tropicus TaxID=1492898 RepID=UPI0013149B23|nr:hypothetical protein [Flavisolibacter tropicus]
MNQLSKKQLVISIILSVIGLAVWISIGLISNKVEAWDSNLYYLAGLPTQVSECYNRQ